MTTYERPAALAGYRNYLCSLASYDEVVAGRTLASVRAPVSDPAGLVFGTPTLAGTKVIVPTSCYGAPTGLYYIQVQVTDSLGTVLPMFSCRLRVT